MKVLDIPKSPWAIILVCLLLGSFIQQSKYVVTATDQMRHIEREVDALIQPLIDSSKAAGISVGVMRNDSILLLKSYGYADLELNTPLPTNASFEIGSTTKQFTAVAILQLVDKGLIKLSDPVDKHLTFTTKAYKPTIGQLLNHTAGIKAPDQNEYRAVERSNYQRDTMLRFVEKSGFDFEPGTAMLYSNTGYFLLGLVIEKVTGDSYEDYLRTNVLAKAGMGHTYYSDAETIRKNRTQGYNNLRNNRQLIRAELPHYRWTYSAGALSSTVEDLLHWNKALHTNGQVLSQRGYQQLIAPGRLTNGMVLRYASGLQTLRYKGYRIIGHGGSGSGCLAQSCYFPDQKLTIVTLQNTYRPVSEAELAYAIADKILPPIKSKNQERFGGNLTLLTVTYKSDFEIDVSTVNGRLIIKRPWQKTGDTLTYIGNQKWSIGNDHYSFALEKGQVKALHWDAVYAYITLKR